MIDSIEFTKMHGLGNDFIIINCLNQTIKVETFPFTEYANRNIGIGFDQLLLIEPSKNADFFCRIFNADGSEAQQCGNGLRCVARYLHESGLTSKNTFSLETKAGIFPVQIHDYDHIQIQLNIPTVQEPLLKLDKDLSDFAISIISVGNPHAILKVKDIQSIDADILARKIAALSYFPDGVNVGFMQVKSPDHICLRTIERGTGETLACGSNACAAVVSGIINNWLDKKTTVELTHGNLTVEWQSEQEPVIMTGPAVKVFEGKC